MSKYKDRYGNQINEGDTVLQLISMNMERHSSPYTVMLVKKKSNKLILDGVYGWGHLSSQKSSHMCVLKEGTDLRKVHCDFLRMQSEIYDPLISGLKYEYNFLPNDVYDTLESICRAAGHKGPIHKETVDEILVRIQFITESKEIDEEKLNNVVGIIKRFEDSRKELSGCRDLHNIFKNKELGEKV